MQRFSLAEMAKFTKMLSTKIFSHYINIYSVCNHTLGEGLAPASRDSKFDPFHFSESLLEAAPTKGTNQSNSHPLSSFSINMEMATDPDNHVIGMA